MNAYVVQFIHKDGNGYAIINATSEDTAKEIFLEHTQYENPKVTSTQQLSYCGNTNQIVTEGAVSSLAYSPYDLAVLNGYTGTLAEFLEQGDSYINNYVNTTVEGHPTPGRIALSLYREGVVYNRVNKKEENTLQAKYGRQQLQLSLKAPLAKDEFILLFFKAFKRTNLDSFVRQVGNRYKKELVFTRVPGLYIKNTNDEGNFLINSIADQDAICYEGWKDYSIPRQKYYTDIYKHVQEMTPTVFNGDAMHHLCFRGFYKTRPFDPDSDTEYYKRFAIGNLGVPMIKSAWGMERERPIKFIKCRTQPVKLRVQIVKLGKNEEGLYDLSNILEYRDYYDFTYMIQTTDKADDMPVAWWWEGAGELTYKYIWDYVLGVLETHGDTLSYYFSYSFRLSLK